MCIVTFSRSVIFHSFRQLDSKREIYARKKYCRVRAYMHARFMNYEIYFAKNSLSTIREILSSETLVHEIFGGNLTPKGGEILARGSNALPPPPLNETLGAKIGCERFQASARSQYDGTSDVVLF